MNQHRFSRRYFFYGSLLAGAIPRGGFGSEQSLKALGFKSVLDKLNIAGVGVGGRGAADLQPMSVSENIVALCDVNDTYAAHTFDTYPKAKKFKDFRKMFDAESKNIDGVVIGTPDHGHTPIALHAMQAGLNVYCEKPLTRTVWEARLLHDAANKYKVATQMGNQGFSHEGTRTAAEILWSGDIGSVKEVHSWTGGIYGGRPEFEGPPPVSPIPPDLDWDLWLGTAEKREFNEDMFKRWRAWIDFSAGGSLGDWIVHCLGPAHLALQLHLAPPTSVECVTVTGQNQWLWPMSSHLRYEFPERGGMPAVTVNVYQNMRGDVAYPAGMADDEPLLPPSNNLTDRGRFAPPDPGGRSGLPGAMPQGMGGRGGRGAAAAPAAPRPVQRDRVPGNGTLFVGDKGYMATTSRGEGVWLLPASRWKDYRLPPQLLPRSVNHQQDWLRSCKGGAPGCSNFNIAVPYIEWLILGAVALRVPNKKLLWDARKMQFTNSAEATALLKPTIRKGWELKL
jgi:Oxidoreductase family, NAD-binding Rossmann fold/Oxidoreductase family, C-terminal alpha/beta domain